MSDPKQFDSGNVPAPCSVRWSLMRGTGVTRTCAACDRQVHDLSAMTTAQIETLLAPGDNRICVRLCRGSDGRIVTADHPAATATWSGVQEHTAHIRKSPFSGASVAALAALIGMAHPAVGSATAAQAQRTHESPRAGASPDRRKTEGTISGVVRQTHNEAEIADAAVVVISEETGEEYTTRSSNKGTFMLKVPEGLYTVSVTGDFSIPGGASSIKVNARRTSAVVVELSLQIIGEYVRMYPDTPPPPLSTLEPRDMRPRPTRDRPRGEAEPWKVTSWLRGKIEWLKASLSGN
jgi:hypothetical protein